MKTIMFVSLFSFLSVGVFAQNDLSLKLASPIDFNSGKLAMDSTYFSFKDAKENTSFHNYFTQPQKVQPNLKTMNYYSEMPIVKPPGNNWNMPIVVPDSTVNYAIREKRINTFVLSESEK